MTEPKKKRSQKHLRIAITAAALGVAGCFTAAFTFADRSAEAATAGPIAKAD
ncbi:hypothetical protein [Qipengyuania flava]|uniref:hypothetical protein n=1 Tax=Qipengyuania flava TaxID=192812 RepID=UPI001C637A1D|nr:hypothetical protein [Qipengyuania flava]QYJ07650.1 hypothetical protein KUV82_02705 [Qipengyuania flava]